MRGLAGLTFALAGAVTVLYGAYPEPADRQDALDRLAAALVNEPPSSPMRDADLALVVVDPQRRPDYIFNPSNDGWFGAWGPPQHLAQARMRAIEEGLPVLRATTTGISAVIDARGVVREAIGRNRAARIDGLVPPADPATPFALLAHWLTLIWGVVLLGAGLVASSRRAR